MPESPHLLSDFQRIIYRHLYKQSDDAMLQTIQNLVMDNNMLHGGNSVAGAILYQGGRYCAGYHTDDVMPHYRLDDSLVDRFEAWRTQSIALNQEKDVTRRLFPILFNMLPSEEQIIQAIGSNLLQIGYDALRPAYRTELTTKLRNRKPAPEFDQFLQENHDHFRLVQERVIRNMLTLNKS